MCGVAGIYSYGANGGAADVDEVLAIRDHMASRGPDGAGLWKSDDHRVVLAHRRLAIIGLGAQGAQPMTLTGACGGRRQPLVVSFNGELYNHSAARQSLERGGHQFTTATDTEVLLHLYEEYAEDLVRHLRGMFAFALWDGERRRLFLARDPYGIKPLYYANDGSRIRVASQARALVEAGRVPKSRDPAAPAALLVLGSLPEPGTAWAAVRAVPAGSMIVVDELGVGPSKVWCRPEDVMATVSAARPVNGEALVADAVSDSVAAHLVADVPVGVFLSAGIDSGAVLGIASSQVSTIVAVTLGFDEYAGYSDDEVPLAAEVAGRYGAEHVVARTSSADVRAALPQFFSTMDQPTVDGLNSWLVSRAAAQAGVKVVLSGTGGDELLGGYPTFQKVPQMARSLGLLGRLPAAEQLVRRAGGLGARIGVSPKAARLLEFGTSLPGVWGLRHALFMPSDLPQVLGEDAAAESLAALDLTSLFGPHIVQGQKGPIAVGMMESSMYLRNQLLRDTDWASMAHSVEVRLPLVDAHLLRRLSASLPSLMLGAAGKKALGASPRPALPAAVVERRKTGFSTPLAQWITSWDETDGWRRVPTLQHPKCPWARRWAYVVAERFGMLST